MRTCKGCRKTTTDFLASFFGDGRWLNFCRERGCADRWLSATAR
ncbi:hypothetical protein M2302_002252 [Micromonospora sp. A200]|nr:hypothetical protein [Micromonospora sp. A200]MDH6462077.1 hypothetical protein [Micromonospora sp. A200]